MLLQHCQTAHLQEKHLLPNWATRHVKSAGKVNHFGQFGSRCFRTRQTAYIPIALEPNKTLRLSAG